MDPFSGFNPWLVIAAAVFVGFVLGRVTASGGPPSTQQRRGRSRVAYVPIADLDKDDQAALREIYQAEGKIAAIKHFRELTGQGLKDAKDAVEGMFEK